MPDSRPRHATRWKRRAQASLVVAILVLATRASLPEDPESFRARVEADWILQEAFRRAPTTATTSVTTADDAGGACDGVVDGTYGFHTALDQSPWWQVDLGGPRRLDRVVVWNRCDGASERCAHLQLLLSDDGQDWGLAYAHDGTTFLGKPDGKPLSVPLSGRAARLVRIRLPETTYLHLDEVQVFGAEDPAVNIALHRPADQSSVSPWSRGHAPPQPEVEWARRTREILSHAVRLAAELEEAGAQLPKEAAEARALASSVGSLADSAIRRKLYFRARWIQRRLTLAHPILDFDAILFTKRVPGTFNHMSDQYLGWWSRPGGGIHILRGFRGDSPTVECVSGAFREPGSFLRPSLSCDAKRVLFAWCRYEDGLAGEPNKLDKGNVPEDAFYHIFEMAIDGSGVKRLTRGKYDDFDARWLPDGRIVFLSTRRGQSPQCGSESARGSVEKRDLPDVYVRCGGGPERPCAVYTLHTMDADGGNLCAISPFEMFEWTPSVAADGTILYSRWDYVDRDNMPFMSLWSMRPDGTNARLVYGNFTRSPHCTFEPRSVPNSRKIVFTASAHHAQTMGSIVLLDPALGDEGPGPIERLTPEVAFPEAEGWPVSSYAAPYPLSERWYLVTWGAEGSSVAGPPGWDRWHAVLRPPNGMRLYLLDAEGNMELLHSDPEISCFDPIPVRPQPRPPTLSSEVRQDGPREGSFLLVDVYRGLKAVRRGDIHALRIVAVPPKTHPTMNFPNLGLTSDDPGKCVLGTVPVEADGSAHFRVPAGLIVFFQALDERGMAVQTMRSATHVQPGQTLGCIGCHESRTEAPPQRRTLAAAREPSRITPAPSGSWPLRFDVLVGPVLERRCVGCHSPEARGPTPSQLDLTPAKAYEALVRTGSPSLAEVVAAGYRRGYSIVGDCGARRSAVLAKVIDPAGHHGVRLDAEDLERLVTWMDVYAQRSGSFGPDQEARLEDLRRRSAGLLAERPEDRAPESRR